MKTFAVYEKSENNRAAVKVGFCWPGVIWSGFWLLFVRLWEQAGIAFGTFVLCYATALAFFFEANRVDTATAIVSPVSLAIAIIIGTKGNRWRQTNLRARGFNLVAVVSAKSKDEAIVKLRDMSPEELSVAKEQAPRRIKAPYEDGN